MNKIGMKLLADAKAAESTLRRQELQMMKDTLPPGHPMEGELDKAKAELGGDLDGLPDNHPLIVEIRAAEARAERAEEEAEEKAEEDARKVRKAQKMDRAKARREQIAKEETEAHELRDAATAVNSELETAVAAVRRAYEALEANEEVLARNRMNAARTARLKRLLFAFERGASETRMGRV